ILSQDWLKKNKIDIKKNILKSFSPIHVKRNRMFSFLEPLSDLVQVDEFYLNHFNVPIHFFLMDDLRLFSPPEFVGFCCDGILGLDFLKLYPIKFKSKPYPEIQIMEKKDFHESIDTPWIEVEELKEGG